MTPAPQTISATDIAAFGTLIFLVLSWGVSQIISSLRTKGQDSSVQGAIDASVSEQLKNINKSIESLTTQITKTNDNHVKHEVDCAQFRGATIATLASLNEESKKHGRRIDNLNSQLGLAVAGGANRLIEMGHLEQHKETS